MSDAFKELLANVPAAAAVIYVVTVFLKHVTEERSADRAMWENHLSKVVDRLDEMALVLKEISTRQRMGQGE